MPKGVYPRKPLTDEHKKNLSNSRKGVPNPGVSKALTERKQTIEQVQKRINKLIGQKRTEEQKKNISLSKIGRPNGLLGKHWKHSLESRKNMSESHKGEKCHTWKGGITPINKKIRESLEYKLWRKSVFERDNYTCVLCGIRSGWNKELRIRTIIHADHIKPFALYPELRFAIDNGRTLCIDCHKKTDTYGKIN